MLDNSSAQENSGTEKVSLRQGQLEIIIYEENELQSESQFMRRTWNETWHAQTLNQK